MSAQGRQPLPANLAHVATVRRRIDDVCESFDYQLHEEVDDLDHLQWTEQWTSGGFPFRLSRYRGAPAGTFDILFESQRADWEERLNEVLNALSISREELLWLNQDYFRTP
jgi:hypothetical protein